MLRAILISLEQHFMFAGQQGIELEVTFPQRLTHLISSRPGVCADAMDAFPDLWGMAIRVTYAEFLRYLDVKFACRSENADLHVVLKIVLPGSNEVAEVMIPLALLQSICVCLSIWKNDDVKFDVALNDAVQILTDYVLGRVDDFKDDNVGLSGAVLKTGGASSVSVESVGLLFSDLLACLLYVSLLCFSTSGLCLPKLGAMSSQGEPRCLRHRSFFRDCFSAPDYRGPRCSP